MSHPNKRKPSFHPRNEHQGRYDLTALQKAHPSLQKHIINTDYGTESVNFFEPEAVISLNTALLKLHYGVKSWSLPDRALCPPVPGRADYIHHLADLIYGIDLPKKKTKKSRIKILDIGTGSSIIYPIVGGAAYGWQFVGTDINKKALEHAQQLIDDNELDHVELRLQPKKHYIFENIIDEYDYFDALMCNPPFFTSEKAAASANRRKNKNLGNKQRSHRNFGGLKDELWCEGGEVGFISDLITESSRHPAICYWYTTLVSREEHIKELVVKLKEHNPTEIRYLDMTHGNKITRVLCWTYLTDKQKTAWKNMREI